MQSKLLLLAGILAFASCNSEEKASTTPTEKTTEKANDNTAEIAELNAQSKTCIRTMNSAEEAKNAAIASSDTQAAAAAQKTIDSAAKANVMIGQKLMELQK